MVKQVYHYAVAFITLIMVISGGVFAFMSVADYISPNIYIETFEDYKSMREHKNETDHEASISESDLIAQYDAMLKQKIEYQKQSALNGLIKSLGWIFIPLPIFVFFQRKINREKNITK
ncbi:hypothetical protein [Halalkalibacter flavus]|uniref:hypothetical protein n=1 Tax=Halalkalibacter flavus TaxID=3090668 RepID=UPI002FC650D5